METSTGRIKQKSGISVSIKECKNFEDMMRKFKRKVIKNEILKEAKSRTEYTKPSDKKRRKRNLAIKNMQKEQMEKEYIKNNK